MCDLGPRPRRPYLVITCESTAWNPFFLWFLGSVLPRVFNLGCHVLSCCLLVPLSTWTFPQHLGDFFLENDIYLGSNFKNKIQYFTKAKNNTVFHISHFFCPWSSSHSQIFLIFFPSSIELQPQPFANHNPQSAPKITIHNPQLTVTDPHRARLPQPSRDNKIEFFNI